MDERIMHQILGKQGRSINLEWRHSLNGWWATNNNYRSPPVDPRLGLTTPSWTKRDWFEDAVESYLYWVDGAPMWQS